MRLMPRLSPVSMVSSSLARRLGIRLAARMRALESGNTATRGLDAAQRGERLQIDPEAPSHEQLRHQTHVGQAELVTDQVAARAIAGQRLQREEAARDEMTRPNAALDLGRQRVQVAQYTA